MIKVLDKGYVNLIRHMGDDISIVEDARMSTDNKSNIDVAKDDNLRNYLWKNAHTSPSEGCVMTVEMKIPLFVLRQLDRHRTLDIDNLEINDYDEFRKYTSRNEFSGRYAEFDDEFYFPEPSRIQKQDSVNKQGSGSSFTLDEAQAIIESLKEDCFDSYLHYQVMIKKGLAKELARIWIPVNVYTKIRVTANLLNWLKMLKLRLDPHAQYEVRVYAEAIAEIIKQLWPKAWQVFEENTLYGTQLSRTEIQAITKELNAFDLLCRHVNMSSLIGPITGLKESLGKSATAFFKKFGIKETNE